MGSKVRFTEDHIKAIYQLADKQPAPIIDGRLRNRMLRAKLEGYRIGTRH
ncbi:hypothetical protein LVY72_22575 [Arthrobacter sp. I2-34]|uniref:Transposase n=1 Tax=Arthrobacter hankyongi TaxID=2904801 RepID=A0ABS9LDB6_9MICC|nr:hypothetical protein [Arthrobacter hankyongi]MCG2624679.1 hypothetical protein [Arthrobacter hankyongi]